MIYSMTGYGKGTAENKKINVEVEVKSVNSRYLDIYFKLPSSLMSKEYELRELIKSKIKRGKLTVVIQFKRSDSEENLPEINKDKIISYVQLLKEIKKAAKITEAVKLEHILNNKDIFAPESSDFSAEEFEVIKKTLFSALSELSKMKKNEGKELAVDLRKRIEIIEEYLDEIQSESGKSAEEYFGKLKEKIKTLLDDVSAFNDRLELELAIIAEKSEITEECVRLRSHLKFFLESLDKDEEPGRKINFLCQEMNRETNTISSKTISTAITHKTVLIKEEIEKIREQIQNIE